LECYGLVKTGFELANWPVHKDDSRALGDPDNTAQPVLKAYDVADAESELVLFRAPEQADEFGLIGVATIPLSEFRFHRSVIEAAQFAERTVLGVAHDDVIEHFDSHQLPGSHEVARDLDVGFRWGWLA